MTYMVVVFLVATLSIMAMLVSENWVVANRRSAERELLFVGEEFRFAIKDYYERTPGTLKRYPATLEDLLLDKRHLGVVRHLRRMYADPLTHSKQWGLIRAPDGGIQGVYSLAEGGAMKRTNFDDTQAAFEGATSYAEWQFMHVPDIAPETRGNSAGLK